MVEYSHSHTRPAVLCMRELVEWWEWSKSGMRDAGCDGWMGDAQHWDGLGLGFLGWAGVTSWSVGQGPESQVRVQGKDKGKDNGEKSK